MRERAGIMDDSAARHLSPDQFGDVAVEHGDNGWDGPLGSYGDPAAGAWMGSGYQGQAGTGI